MIPSGTFLPVDSLTNEQSQNHASIKPAPRTEQGGVPMPTGFLRHGHKVCQWGEHLPQKMHNLGAGIARLKIPTSPMLSPCTSQPIQAVTCFHEEQVTIKPRLGAEINGV
jgi:hypothetical protein